MTPQQRRGRSRRLACVAATVAATAALAAGPGFAAGLGVVVADPPPVPPAAPRPEATGPHAVLAPPPQQAAPSGPATPSVPASPSVAVTPPAPASPSAPAAVPVPAIPSVPSTAPAPAVPLVPETPAVPAPPAGPAPAKDVPAFGAYLDYGPRGVARIAEFSRWLGGAELRVGHTYLPGDRWSNIEGRPGFLAAWADWRNRRADRMLVLNVPMLERNEEGVPDAEVRALLRQGAAGRFDHHFRALAERLVALRVPDTVLVLGWEMNGTTYTHRCGPDPESWKKYWNRIVTTMRSVPGQEFRFDFTPSRGKDAVAWTECYPGDDVVDIVGMDSYDQPAGMSFDEQVSEPYGLRRHVEFAAKHGKPISYPEWGLFRNGDNAEYMRRMLAWMDEHRPLYNTLTDYCPHGVWQCDENPEAAEVYRSVLSGRTGGPAAPPVSPSASPSVDSPASPPATEPAPQPSADCTPLDLGDWVEHWLGGKLCMRADWWTRFD
ncbi:glycoside hydrolase family 26 protein [Streptomyces pharetrae]|uniref:glycoside hydrolase family 26 protein n=1 Tax=Streptomyces pharetrae TaxID=291370 RepID=UPI0015705190